MAETETTVTTPRSQGRVETKVPFRPVTLVSVARIGRPTYSPEVTEHIRRVVAEMLSGGEYKSLADLGRAIGISGQAVGKFLYRGGGISRQQVVQLAKIRGVSPEDLEDPSARTKGTRSAVVTIPLARYNNADLAAEVARRQGVAQEAIDWVCGGNYSLPEDASPEEWWNAMKLHDAQVKRERKALGQDRVLEEKQRGADERRIADAKRTTKPRLPKKQQPTR